MEHQSTKSWVHKQHFKPQDVKILPGLFTFASQQIMHVDKQSSPPAENDIMFKKCFHALVCLLGLSFHSAARADIWVNELNYESFPNVEIVVSPTSAGVNLSSVLWSLYDGTTGSVYASHALNTFTVGATVNNYTLYSLTGFAIQNGGPSGGPNIPDGWAISVNGVIQEFKSYEGSFTATSGVAQGLTSMDIGVRQETGTPTSSSMQLLDTGTVAAHFRWIPGQGPSFGQVNLGQVLAVPEPSTIALMGACIAGVLIRRRIRKAVRRFRTCK